MTEEEAMAVVTLHSAVNSAAKILMSRYHGHVEYDDLTQEMWCWLAENEAKVTKWAEEREGDHFNRTLTKALRNVGERYAREERAQHLGYDPEDEFFYSIPMVADLLRLHLDPEYPAPPPVNLESVANGNPASEGGNLMTMVADVARAFSGLPVHDRALLERVYGPGSDERDALATLEIEWECSSSAAYNRVRRVVGRVRAALGGEDPKESK